MRFAWLLSAALCLAPSRGMTQESLREQIGTGGPRSDQDRDGVADDIDECPRAAETRNGRQDADGCPDASGAVEEDDDEPWRKPEVERERASEPAMAFGISLIALGGVFLLLGLPTWMFGSQACVEGGRCSTEKLGQGCMAAGGAMVAIGLPMLILGARRTGEKTRGNGEQASIALSAAGRGAVLLGRF